MSTPSQAPLLKTAFTGGLRCTGRPASSLFSECAVRRARHVELSRDQARRLGYGSPMLTLARISLVSLAILSCAQVPCYAQHMNAVGAPCQQPASNAETTQCFLSASKRANEKLNRTYSQIRKILGADDLRKLQDAERFWIQYRDATCMAERDLYGNGTGAYPAHAACLEAETRFRVNDLNATYGWRVEKFSK